MKSVSVFLALAPLFIGGPADAARYLQFKFSSLNQTYAYDTDGVKHLYFVHAGFDLLIDTQDFPPYTSGGLPYPVGNTLSVYYSPTELNFTMLAPFDYFYGSLDFPFTDYSAPPFQVTYPDAGSIAYLFVYEGRSMSTDVSYSSPVKLTIRGFDSDVDLDSKARLTVWQTDVPEPSAWALMVSGFALVGGAMRRQRTRVRFA